MLDMVGKGKQSIFEPVSSFMYKFACVYSEDSDRAAHPEETVATHRVPSKTPIRLR